VLHCDWQSALAAAPRPCAQRQGLAVAAGAMQRPMPCRLAPLLLPSLAVALRLLSKGTLPLPPTAVACVTAARMAQDGYTADGISAEFEAVLQGLGVVTALTQPGPHHHVGRQFKLPDEAVDMKTDQ
jgi:hypothetical protein